MENNISKKKHTNIKFIIPLIVLIVLCLAFIFVRGYRSGLNQELVISLDGERYTYDDGTYPTLNDTKQFTITTELGFNTINISNGFISVVDSDCRDEVCIHTGKINFTTDTDMIVCAPHRLCIYIR
ncbi:MAG: NusG domain II-containing protein [Lachnospiraceae bacterium]|nr:NusG domain II-containing protein [Lachnospiraceae bacterium]